MEGRAHKYDIALVCDDLNSNSMGRVLSLWELAEDAGITAAVVPAKADTIWPPLRDSRILENVFPVYESDGLEIGRRVRPSVIVCVKLMGSTLEVAVPWSRRDKVPLVLDIDDPDLEIGLLEGSPLRAIAKSVVRRRTMQWLRWARSNHGMYPTTVSNPILQEKYGGTIIPHVHRFDDRLPRTEPRNPLDVAFVGTIRQHKGISQLRESVAANSGRGFTLTITGDAPDDAHEWEKWISNNTLSEGRQIVRDAGIVAIPSLDTGFARGQLPSKLIDAMVLGKAIVASDLPPIRWALGDAGILVSPGNVDELSRAIASLGEPELRRHYQMKAYERSASLFGIEKYTSAFREIIEATAAPKAGDR